MLEAVVQPTCAHALSCTLYMSQQFASSRQGEIRLCQVQTSGADIKAKREYHFNSVGGVYCSCKYGTLVYTVLLYKIISSWGHFSER